MKMTRISIPVSVAERDALLVNAERNLRHPREQARFLLRLALGLATDPNKSETADKTLMAIMELTDRDYDLIRFALYNRAEELDLRAADGDAEARKLAEENHRLANHLQQFEDHSVKKGDTKMKWVHIIDSQHNGILINLSHVDCIDIIAARWETSPVDMFCVRASTDGGRLVELAGGDLAYCQRVMACLQDLLIAARLQDLLIAANP